MRLVMMVLVLLKGALCLNASSARTIVHIARKLIVIAKSVSMAMTQFLVLLEK